MLKCLTHREYYFQGGKVTSTMLYCWMAAVLDSTGTFMCTGTLLTPYLILTSASCVHQ